MPIRAIYRETFPRIRSIVKRGSTFYQVDPRPHGKQVSFSQLATAKKRANEIAADFERLGSEGVNFATELRVMALNCETQLNPWNKTIADATVHYVQFLQDQHTKFQSKTVDACVDEWVRAKESGERKKLRTDTLRDIKQTAELLRQIFGGQRILAIKRPHIEKYIDPLPVELRRKENLRNRMGQFFNWCKASRYIAVNPCEGTKYGVEDAEVVILTAEEARNMLALGNR